MHYLVNISITIGKDFSRPEESSGYLERYHPGRGNIKVKSSGEWSGPRLFKGLVEIVCLEG